MESVSGSDVRLRRVGAVGLRRVGAAGLGNRTRQEFARGMHRHVAVSRGFGQGTLLQSTVTGHPSQGKDTGHCHWILPQDTVTGHPSLEALPRISATNLCRGSTSQWHINKDTPDDFSSGVSEERQLPTLPPGLAVPSAMTGLASLFGMGRGGSPSL